MNRILSIFSFCLLAVFNLTYVNCHEKTSLPPALCSLTSENDKKLVDEFRAEQMNRIDELSQTINVTNGLDDLSVLCLYNERGIAYFFAGELENALNDFNYVLIKLETQQTLEKEIIGTALWGRLFCHAFKNQVQETYDDSLMIQWLFTGCSCCEERLKKESFVPASNCRNDFFVLPIAKFANPEEKISKWECHDRTKGISDKMRSLADLVPIFVVRTIVLFTIDKLEDRAHACCESGNNWTVCLGPIADAWQKLDDTWDQLVELFQKGIKIETFLTAPSNL